MCNAGTLAYRKITMKKEWSGLISQICLHIQKSVTVTRVMYGLVKTFLFSKMLNALLQPYPVKVQKYIQACKCLDIGKNLGQDKNKEKEQDRIKLLWKHGTWWHNTKQGGPIRVSKQKCGSLFLSSSWSLLWYNAQLSHKDIKSPLAQSVLQPTCRFMQRSGRWNWIPNCAQFETKYVQAY